MSQPTLTLEEVLAGQLAGLHPLQLLADKGTRDVLTFRIVAPGHSWKTGDRAPDVPRWSCFWVSHFGDDRTEWTYHHEDRDAALAG